VAQLLALIWRAALPGLAALIALPSPTLTIGRGASPAGETCTSVYAYHPVETPLRVSSDLTVRLRNPYGSRVNIGRFFVSFRIVYASAADRAKVSAVQWTLDGAPVRSNRGGRDAYVFGSFHLTPGPHVIAATITPVGGGANVTGELRFTATGCAPLGFGAGADNRKAAGAQPTAFWVYTGTTPIDRVALGGRSTLVSTAPRLRGRKVGELRYVTGTRVHVRALRLPKRWADPHAISLLRDDRLRVVLHPGARRMLDVTGLPDAVSTMHLSFGGPRQIGQLPIETSTGAPAGTPGLVGTSGRCKGATWEAWVAGSTGPTAHATSAQGGRAFAACQRR
jgi:hypothetical protein